MFTSLTRLKRLRAGWIVALTYLLCVLAPTLSFALPGSRAASPCLAEAAVGHTHMDASIQHVRIDGRGHDHANAHSHGSSGDLDRAMSTAIKSENDKSVPEKAPHSSDGQCCGLMCVTALPATLNDIAKPSAPMALCEVEGYLEVTDNAPPRHYRPPIS
jgi:hypothetical protein